MAYSSDELDPRYEWIETTPFGKAQSEFIAGMCKHLMSERVDVWTYVNEIPHEKVASLCMTCDAQLPPLFTTE